MITKGKQNAGLFKFPPTEWIHIFKTRSALWEWSLSYKRTHAETGGVKGDEGRECISLTA